MRKTMGALTEFLFPAPAKRKASAILGWWEKRRPAYNLAVGAAGLFSLGVMTVFVALPPFGSSLGLPWQGVVLFGGMANLCYFFGPATEMLIDKIWGREVLPTGPALFRIGLTFSVGLALLPALISVILWVARLVFGGILGLGFTPR